MSASASSRGIARQRISVAARTRALRAPPGASSVSSPKKVPGPSSHRAASPFDESRPFEQHEHPRARVALEGEDLAGVARHLARAGPRGARGLRRWRPRRAESREARRRSRASSYHDRAAIPAQRSHSGNHGAHDRPHERQRPIVGDSTSTRSRATTRAAAASSRAAARSIVTPPTPGYWSANQRRMLASRPARSASSSDAPRRRAVSRRKRDLRTCDAVARDRERERREELEPVLVDGRVDELPRVREREACGRARRAGAGRPGAEAGAAAATRRRASSRRPTRGARPGARRRVPRRAASGIVDAEIGELRADARLVDGAVAEVAAGQRDVRLERGLDELRVRDVPSRGRRARRRVLARRGRSDLHGPRSARAPTAGGRAAPRRRTSSSRRTGASRTGGSRRARGRRSRHRPRPRPRGSGRSPRAATTSGIAP